MLTVLRHSWPLLLGIMLLMVGNGVQSTLLGIRGNIEGFSTLQLSIVMSGYFLGFLFGSNIAPRLLRRVGHVRVFSALGSLISAILVIYPVMPDWMVWAVLRVVMGFAFSGIYITAESWLNNTASNDNRGQALSAYMIVQMIGIITSQVLLNVADPAGFTLFVIPSVLVSLAFMPILLAVTPSPKFELTQGISFRELFAISPLGCVGMLLTGGIFSALFGMASVWGAQTGLSVREISIFIGSMYLGGLVAQYPIGWMSDHMDRRQLIFALSLIGAVLMVPATLLALPVVALMAVSAALGAITNPLYALLIAYTNDFVAKERMAATSAGMLFLNGLGAIFGPIVTGWIMEMIGPEGFFLFVGVLFALLAGYAAWRMTRRAVQQTSGGFATLAPTATALAVSAAVEKQAGDQP